MIKNLLLTFTLSLYFINTHSQTITNKKQAWKTNDYINSSQILLTNEYKFGNSVFNGASSFLIETAKDTLLCTAKHLLGDAMGVIPEIKTSQFNKKLQYWKVYPRNNKLSKDTIWCTQLINEELNDIDIILLNCKLNQFNNIIPLKPRLTPLKSGEKLEIIGCEYEDFNCHQKKYNAILKDHYEEKILIESKTKFSMSGFSGAPVIDSNGYIVGVLSGGGEIGGQLYLTVTPITKLKNYLK